VSGDAPHMALFGKGIVAMSVDAIKSAIRDVPDFPKPGILFKDITPVLQDAALFKATIDIFEERCRIADVSKIAAIDARGFLFAGAVCDRMGLGLVPVRKQGKLPYQTFEQTYELEYGSATLAIHRDAFDKGERVLVLDDLLATGGTAAAAAKLVEQAGGVVAEIAFLVELAFLDGRAKLQGYQVFSPVVF
jgi:adenine phosphoribosyltransferase